jgi:Helix-turn-helix domain
MTSAFTCIPNAVVLNAGLSPTAHWLYEILRMHNNVTNGCFPGQETLAKEMLLSLSTIQRAMRELVTAKLIACVRRGKRQTNEYSFIDDTSPVTNHEQGDTSPVTSHHEGDTSVMTSHEASDTSSMTGGDTSQVTYPNSNKIKSEQDTVTTPNVVVTDGVSPPSQNTLAIKTPTKETPYSLMILFYEKMGTPPPVDQRTKKKCLGQAKLLLERGATGGDLDSLIESCAWARDVDMGTLLANYEKWRIGRNHQPAPPKLTGKAAAHKQQLDQFLDMARGEAR